MGERVLRPEMEAAQEAEAHAAYYLFEERLEAWRDEAVRAVENVPFDPYANWLEKRAAGDAARLPKPLDTLAAAWERRGEGDRLQALGERLPAGAVPVGELRDALVHAVGEEAALREIDAQHWFFSLPAAAGEPLDARAAVREAERRVRAQLDACTRDGPWLRPMLRLAGFAVPRPPIAYPRSVRAPAVRDALIEGALGLRYEDRLIEDPVDRAIWQACVAQALWPRDAAASITQLPSRAAMISYLSRYASDAIRTETRDAKRVGDRESELKASTEDELRESYVARRAIWLGTRMASGLANVPHPGKHATVLAMTLRPPTPDVFRARQKLQQCPACRARTILPSWILDDGQGLLHRAAVWWLEEAAETLLRKRGYVLCEISAGTRQALGMLPPPMGERYLGILMDDLAGWRRENGSYVFDDCVAVVVGRSIAAARAGEFDPSRGPFLAFLWSFARSPHDDRDLNRTLDHEIRNRRLGADPERAWQLQVPAATSSTNTDVLLSLFSPVDRAEAADLLARYFVNGSGGEPSELLALLPNPARSSRLIQLLIDIRADLDRAVVLRNA